MTDRAAALRLLWAAVRRIPDGEEILRDRVAALNERDKTNTDVRGTPEYGSTKRLTERQLYELAEQLRALAQLPAPSRYARGPRGGRARRPSPDDPRSVIHLATKGERDYVEHLFGLLKWSADARERFIARQTKGAGLRTHRACSAVVEPLERMLQRAGFMLTERDRVKRWSPPPSEKS